MSIRWQKILAQGFGDSAALLAYLGLPDTSHDLSAAQQFSVRVPKGFADRMHYGDPSDPLLRQVLAVSSENDQVEGYEADPLQELKNNPLPGLIHKYHSRVLITLTGGCAINCRYCFRRHFPYQNNRLGRSQWQDILAYLQADNTLSEVIFSGGDPLLLADEALIGFINDIEAIEHVETLRFHSRIPIVLPERITAPLIERLTHSRLRQVLVTHCNHANELGQEHTAVFTALRQAGIVLLNQSVLLKGVNDDLTALTQLSHRLFEQQILPYYLHVLDKVQGAAHFDVNEACAKRLHQSMQQQLPGYLVPRLVREKAGILHKVWLNTV